MIRTIPSKLLVSDTTSSSTSLAAAAAAAAAASLLRLSISLRIACEASQFSHSFIAVEQLVPTIIYEGSLILPQRTFIFLNNCFHRSVLPFIVPS